jgi:hypothetical protein
LPIATCCRESLCTSFVAACLGEVVDQPTLRRHGLAVNEDLEVMYLSRPHTGVVNVERESGRASAVSFELSSCKAGHELACTNLSIEWLVW